MTCDCLLRVIVTKQSCVVAGSYCVVAHCRCPLCLPPAIVYHVVTPNFVLQVSMETNESLQGFADNKRAGSGRRFASALEQVSMMTNETLQGFAESKSSKGLRLFPAGGN